MDPLKYLFEKPTLNGRLSRWLILLAEFDLKYMARKPNVSSLHLNPSHTKPKHLYGQKHIKMEDQRKT